MGLPSLKIHLRTNQHSSSSFPSLTNDVFFFADQENPTFANPGVCFWASIVGFPIRSFFVFDGSLAGFSFFFWKGGLLVLLSTGLSGQFWEMWPYLLQVKQWPSVCCWSTSCGAVALALPWIWQFRFAEQFLSARVSIAFGSGNSILTFKILAKSAAEKPVNFFWGAFLVVSPWMSLMFWTARLSWWNCHAPSTHPEKLQGRTI